VETKRSLFKKPPMLQAHAFFDDLFDCICQLLSRARAGTNCKSPWIKPPSRAKRPLSSFHLEISHSTELTNQPLSRPYQSLYVNLSVDTPLGWHIYRATHMYMRHATHVNQPTNNMSYRTTRMCRLATLLCAGLGRIVRMARARYCTWPMQSPHRPTGTSLSAQHRPGPTAGARLSRLRGEDTRCK
jgi:hypothetical protein